MKPQANDTMGAVTGHPDHAFQELARAHLKDCPLASTYDKGDDSIKGAIGRLGLVGVNLAQHLSVAPESCGHPGCTEARDARYACYLLLHAAVVVSTCADEGGEELAAFNAALDKVEEELGLVPKEEEEHMEEKKKPPRPVSLAIIAEHLRQRGYKVELPKQGKPIVDGISVPLSVIDGTVTLGALIVNADIGQAWARQRGKSWTTFKPAVLDAIEIWLAGAKVERERVDTLKNANAALSKYEPQLEALGVEVNYSNHGVMNVGLTPEQAETLVKALKAKVSR